MRTSLLEEGAVDMEDRPAALGRCIHHEDGFLERFQSTLHASIQLQPYNPLFKTKRLLPCIHRSPWNAIQGPLLTAKPVGQVCMHPREAHAYARNPCVTACATMKLKITSLQNLALEMSQACDGCSQQQNAGLTVTIRWGDAQMQL